MDKNERNEHFKGFADLLFTEICKLPGIHIETDRPEQEAAIPRLIAQYAYDLAWHIYNLAPVSEYEWRMSDIPDLTEWPTSQ